MEEKIDLKKIERKTYMSFQQDGLIEIMIGIVALCFGLSIATHQYIWVILCWMPIVYLQPLKQRLTVPRLGLVKPSKKHQKVNKTVQLVIGGLLVLSLLGGSAAFAAFQVMPPWLRENVILFPVFLLALGLTANAYLNGIKRHYVFVFLTVVVSAVGLLTQFHRSLYFLIPGSILLTAGIVGLILFLYRYPLPKEGDHAIRKENS